MPDRAPRVGPHADLFELIGVLARRRYHAADRSYASLGLNHTEGRLLTMLDADPGAATQDALSRRLLVDRSNAGRAFKRLEQAGYVAVALRAPRRPRTRAARPPAPSCGSRRPTPG